MSTVTTAGRPRGVILKACAQCGQRYEAASGAQKRCDDCLHVVCEACGERFKLVNGLPSTRRFCSQACRQRVIPGRTGYRADLAERFWSKADRPAGETQCWPWMGTRNHGGYGAFWYEGTNLGAHRMAWELTHEPIPAGMSIDHLCRNTSCVNPSHMEVVTPTVNVLRSTSVSAINARKTECNHGHPLTGDNLRIMSNGERRCRQCEREVGRRTEARRKARRQEAERILA